MRGGEPLPQPAAGEPYNIAYDDPRIVSKLLLDSKQTALVKQQAPEMKKMAEEAPKKKIKPSADVKNKELTLAPKAPEVPLIKNEAAAPEQPEKEWTLQQPATNYTLQLLASKSVSECKNKSKQLFQRYQLSFHVQSFIKNGQKYCVVIHGSYGSYSQAKTMLKK
jgi:septal ring-binding cell division protein DamX